MTRIGNGSKNAVCDVARNYSRVVSVFRGGPVRIAERDGPEKERAEEGRVTTYDDRASLTDLTATVERVRSSVEGVIEGKPEVVRLSLTVLLAEDIF